MASKFVFLAIFLLSLAAVNIGQRTRWDANNYPNPTSSDFHRCRMRSTGLLCDPDDVLSEQERYRLNYELGQMESSTRQEHGRDFCERKGISAAVGIARQVKGGQEQDVRNMANEMLRRWNLDKQCEKAIVIVLSVDDRRFWVARMARVPVYAQEFTEIFRNEQSTFKAGQYSAGLQNVIRQIRDRALSKQVPGAVPDDTGRSRGTPFVPPAPKPSGDGRHGPRGGGGGLSGLSWLLILAIIFFVVIPLLCCCCCIYLCFFRKKGDGSNNRAPAEDPERVGGGARGRGMGGLPLAGLLSGIGGAASGLFGKRRGARGDAGGGAPPPYAPVSPRDDNKSRAGAGLYPSAPVKDEGGGGSF